MKKKARFEPVSHLCCPSCHNPLESGGVGIRCRGCGREYARGEDGFISFLVSEDHDPQHAQQESYIDRQKTYPIRVYRDFLRPLLSAEPVQAALEVGCGLGTETEQARKDGYDAYGIDLPNMGAFWQKAGRAPSHFFKCSAVRLPFRDGVFDFVWSLGVVEHIGTTSDTATLAPDYAEARRAYADELVRVTRPGGRIVVSCPNKSFPIDIQHGPTCGTRFKKLRWHIYNRTKLNLHKTWGRYHLLSYGEAGRLFRGNPAVAGMEALPLRHYFGFNKFRSGYLTTVRALVTGYVEHLPRVLLPTFLNPYMLVMIRTRTAVRDQDGP